MTKEIKAMKASINGPNRRRNRVGDDTIASNLQLNQSPKSSAQKQSTNPITTTTSTGDEEIRFRIRSLESFWEKQQHTHHNLKNAANYDARYNCNTIGNACLFTRKRNYYQRDCTSTCRDELNMKKDVKRKSAWERLVEQHLELTQSSLIVDSDPILIHFHDLPIFILSAIPMDGRSCLDDDDDCEEDVLYMSQVHCHNHKICGTCLLGRCELCVAYNRHFRISRVCSSFLYICFLHFYTLSNNIEDSIYTVTCCSRPQDKNATSGNYDILDIVGVEVFLRYSNSTREELTTVEEEEKKQNQQQKPIVVNATQLSKQILNQTLYSILTVNECVILSHNNVEIVGRIARVCLEDSSKEILADTNTAASAGMEDPFRGRVGIHTEFYISASTQGPSSEVTVVTPKVLTERPLPQDVVHITTSDGEWFPIRRVLLAPCIKLTHCVQAGRGKYKDIPTLSSDEKSSDAPKEDDGRPHVKINMDCCTFDRVLLFILSILYPEEHSFALDLSEVNTLTDAAKELGLQSLEDLCLSQNSSFHSRVRKDRFIRFEEIKRRNESGELLIILDGMVSDVGLFDIRLKSFASTVFLLFSNRSWT